MILLRKQEKADLPYLHAPHFCIPLNTHYICDISFHYCKEDVTNRGIPPSCYYYKCEILVVVYTSLWSCHGELTRLSSSWGGHTGSTSLDEEGGRVRSVGVRGKVGE